MKFVLLLAAALSLGAVKAFSQGWVDFGNGALTRVTAPGLTTNGYAPVGTDVELFYQPGGGSAPAPILSGNTVNFGTWVATAGQYSSVTNPVTMTLSSGVFLPSPDVTGSDVAPGGAAWFTVVAWTGGFADLQTAIDNGAYVGESTIFELTTGGEGEPPILPTPITSNPAGGKQFQGIVLSQVPEPTSVVLGILGVAVLVYFRRHNCRQNY